MVPSSLDHGRRNALKAAGGAILTAGVAGCLGGDGGDGSDSGGDSGSQEWPQSGDSIDLVIAYSQGGGFDWYGRTFAEYLPRYLPNEPDVVPNNVTGGSGIIARNQVFNAEPDGHTVMLRHGLASVESQLAQPEDVDYEVSEYTNLGMCALAFYGMVRRPDMPEIQNWDDIVQAANEGLWGTPGAGVSAHVYTIIFGRMNDAWGIDDVDFVHFDGVGEAMASMDRGEIEYYLPALSSAIPYIDDGICEPMFTFTRGDNPKWDGAPHLVDVEGVPNPDDPINAFRTPRIWSAPPDLPEERAETLGEAFFEAGNDEDLIADAEEAERPLHIEDREAADELQQEMYDAWVEWEDLLRELVN